MDTASFYDSILPNGGLKVLATFRGGLGQPPVHTFHTTNADLINAAAAGDAAGKNVYHACAAYGTTDSRKGDNVVAVKALWTDLDVGPTKPYPTARDAAAAAEAFRVAAGLPATWIVSSGGGVHTYQPFAKPVEPAKWKTIAAMYAACMEHFGVKHDTSRTEDVASVLRVPETSNYKYSPAKPIRILRQGVEVPVREIYEKLKAYADANGVIVDDGTRAKPGATNELVGEREFPPSHGDIIAKHCAVIGQADASGGDNSYEIWWRTLGVAKFCVDPDETATYWTRNRIATGHSQEDWKKHIDNWSTGPTTCAEFSRHTAKCASCPHNGKITSPITLGYPAYPTTGPVPVSTPGSLTPPPPPMPKPWEFAADWIMEHIQKKTRTGYNPTTGKMTCSVQQEDGSYKHEPFCDHYWQVMRRIKDPDGIWQLEIGYQKYRGHPHETFLLDSGAITSPDLLRRAFSERELHIYGGSKAMSVAQHILRENQQLLIAYQQEHVVIPTMGWVTQDGPYGAMTGEFVIGSTMLKPKEAPREIVLAETVPKNMRTAVDTSGTSADWVQLVDFIYNRQGAEPYQFLLSAMFAAPLVRLAPGATAWHGIPIAIWGNSGAAKTTSAQVAMTIYGHPSMFTFQAAKGAGGDTINALSVKMGALKNLPFIADEMSGQEPEHIRDVMYMLANGKAKDRMGQNGQLIPNPYFWATIPLITSNESLHAKVRQLQSQHIQDATALRCFEIEVSKEDLRTVFHDVNKGMIEGDLIAKQYGCVGREWLQFVTNNRVQIAQALGDARRTYKLSDNDQSDVRFYSDLLLTVEIAARLARRRGFIKWDVDAMMAWAKTHVNKLVAGVRERDWHGNISAFVSSLHGRTIVTENMQLGRGRRHKTTEEFSRENLSTHTPPVARKAIKDRLFFVTQRSLKLWCVQERINEESMVSNMLSGGYLKMAADGSKTHFVSISSGTSYNVPRAQCYQFDYDKVAPMFATEPQPGDEGEGTNVVEFPTAPAKEEAPQGAKEATT